jgi:predicted methyltransferase
MSRSWIIAAALATALGSVAAVQATPSYVTAALGDAARPDKEKALDEERKPAEMIAFAGIKPGSRVMDLVPGGGPTKQFADYANVTVLHQPIDKLTAPESLDVVWTAQNYHDLHDKFMGPADLAVVNKAIFDALKPGGVYVIVDHSAKDGTGLAATDTIHRIDEAVVKQEVEAAGFKLAAESNVLRNPADPRDKLVFDPSIRHHTDQFILKFVKPRH